LTDVSRSLLLCLLGFYKSKYWRKNVIAKGNPWQLKRKPTDGALHFDINANMLYASGESDERGVRWACLGHVVPIDPPRWNCALHPKLEGIPYSQGAPLRGFE
jgi:hypothetical protein